MNGENWTQKIMYFSAAGASVSLAFFVAMKFSAHAKAQTAASPTKPTAAVVAAPSPTAPAPAAAGSTAAAPTAPPAAGAPAPTEPPTAGQQGESADISKLEGFLEPFIYDVVNRRDPFMPFADYVPVDSGANLRALSPAQRYDLDQLHLVGVMWDIKEPKAMFMSPEAEIITLGRDEGIGNKNGYIASIREGEVVVVEAIRKRGDVVYKTRVLHLER